MTDQTAILTVIILAVIFFGLWIFTSRQKRRFEEERQKRRKDLERLKAEAREKSRK